MTTIAITVQPITTIAITVRPRVTFSLLVEGTAIGPSGLSAYQVWLDEGNEGTEQDFLDSLKGEAGEDGSAAFGFGTKQTGVDAGVLKEVSFDNDYMYVCVIAGEAGVAVWKKSVLFNT